MAELAQLVMLLAVAGMLARVGWTDFMEMKIFNRDVLIIFGISLLYATAFHFSDLPYRVALAAFLFAVPFVFWLFGTIGAGDVKLMGSLGLLVGFDNALLFVLGVLLASLVLLLALRVSVRLTLVPSTMLQRFMAFLEQRRVPYGVPIAASALIVTGKLIVTDVIMPLTTQPL